jgi:small-conductance mechanosensitive channel
MNQDQGNWKKFLEALFKDAPAEVVWGLIGAAAVTAVILFVLYLGFVFLLLKIKRKIIGSIEKKKGKTLTLQFIEKMITFAMIVLFIVLPLGGDEIANSLLGSTAVVAAVVGFAAQQAIRNMFAGLQISLYKPFDIGSRVELEDGTTGIVENMTLRHIVVCLLDSTRAIIPNSKFDEMKIINYSYAADVPRAAVFKYPIGYDSDIQKAKDVIRKTICECPLTLNEDKYDENEPNSRMVYFLEVQDSALIMGATVKFPANVRSEVIKDEINTSVFNALKENGIEIPFNQLDVHMKNV